MINTRRSPVWLNTQPALRTWYSSGLGQSIATELDRHLDTILPRIFGYQGLQLGGIADSMGLLEKAGIHRKIIIDCPTAVAAEQRSSLESSSPEESGPHHSETHAPSDRNSHATPVTDVNADVISLPIASDVMKLVIMPHTLDFCHQPHQALREADRVLTDDGQMVIIGFNPMGLFGVGRWLRGWQDAAPWNGHFFSRSRVTEWLSVLNYQVMDSTCLYLRPPINSASLLSVMGRIESLQPWLGGLGAVYVLHARKQTLPMTLARYQRRRQAAGLRVTGFASTSNQRQVIDIRDHRDPGADT